MPRYLVISHDSDQYQAFYDFVEAESEEKAKIIVAKARDYAQVIDAWTRQQWEQVPGWSATLHPTQPTTAKALRHQNDDDTRDWCEVCDSDKSVCECQQEPEATNA